jgi:FKBP-type peptidyl-prolyl cis-trans isomerase FklB
MNIFKRAGLLSLLLVTPTAPVLSQDASLDTDMQKYSYAMGFSIGSRVGQQFAAEDFQVDAAAFARAIQDALSGAEPALTPEQMQAVVMAQREQEMAAQREIAEAASARGAAFLSENGAREGVETTDSGLQYEVLRAGDGAMPSAEDTVVVHYRGTLIDGTEFDSSYARNEPAEFPLGGIIQGWQEALQLMKTGGHWKVYIPAALGYGEGGAGNRIGPNETLIFEIELLEIR